MGQPPREGRGRKTEKAVSGQTGENQQWDRRPQGQGCPDTTDCARMEGRATPCRRDPSQEPPRAPAHLPMGIPGGT